MKVTVVRTYLGSAKMLIVASSPPVASRVGGSFPHTSAVHVIESVWHALSVPRRMKHGSSVAEQSSFGQK